MGKFCHECGAKLEPGAKFCGECGATVEAAAPAATKPAAAKAKPAALPVRSAHHAGGANLPAKVVASGRLNRHEDYEVYDLKMNKTHSGNGMVSLHRALSESECQFVFFHMHSQFDKTIVDIETIANLVLQWKGCNASGMKKVKSNGALQKALDACPANKGYIEVLGKTNLSSAIIFDRWRPGSGSKVIQDD